MFLVFIQILLSNVFSCLVRLYIYIYIFIYLYKKNELENKLNIKSIEVVMCVFIYIYIIKKNQINSEKKIKNKNLNTQINRNIS